jgi:prophage regulatory protein
MQTTTIQTLGKPAVCERLNISERTLAWVREGRFPPPVRVGKRCYWADEALQKWHAALFASQLAFNPALGQLGAAPAGRATRR